MKTPILLAAATVCLALSASNANAQYNYTAFGPPQPAVSSQFAWAATRRRGVLPSNRNETGLAGIHRPGAQVHTELALTEQPGASDQTTDRSKSALVAKKRSDVASAVRETVSLVRSQVRSVLASTVVFRSTLAPGAFAARFRLASKGVS